MADFNLKASLDLTELRRGFKEVVTLAQQSGGEVREAFGSLFDSKELAAGLKSALKDVPAQLPAAKSTTSTSTPSSTTDEAEKEKAAAREKLRIEQEAARLEQEQLQKLDALRGQYTDKDKLRQKALSQQLLNDKEAYRKKVEQIQNAINSTDDKAVKKHLQTVKKSYQEEVKLRDQLAREQGVKPALPVQVTNPQSTGLSSAVNFAAINSIVQNLGASLNALQGPFVELDKQVKNIGTLGTKNFEEFAGLASDLSKQIPDDAANIAKGVYQAISAGIQGTNQEIIDFVATAGKAAVAGLSDTETSVNVLTSVLNAYKLQAKDAGKVSDTLFAGIKLGKTSFSELSAGLANVVPAASAAGIKFDEVIASISQMTALGVPTAQATTQIQQAIIQLQKPTQRLVPVLQNIGLSAGNIGEEIRKKGLIATLQEVQTSAKSMGLSLTQTFRSSQAASAAILLTGENAARANKTLAQTRQEIENHAAVGAYAVAAKGIDVQTKIFLNQIQAQFDTVFEAIGSGANVALSTLGKFAPQLTALAGLKEVLPTGLFSKFGSTIKSLVLPALVQMNLVREASVASTTAEAAADAANATAKEAQTVATGEATIAEYALNTALLANPIFLIIAGITAAVGAFLLFSHKTKDLTTAVDDASAAMDHFKEASDAEDTVKRQGDNLRSLADEYDNLKDKTDPESQKRFKEVTDQLAGDVPQATDTVKRYTVAVSEQGEAQGQLQEKTAVSTAVVRDFAKSQEEAAAAAKKDASEDLATQALALGESYQKTQADLSDLRTEAKGWRQQVEQGFGDQKAAGTFFSTVREQLVETLQEQLELNKKIKEQEDKIRPIIDQYQEMGLSAADIAQAMGFTVDQVNNLGGGLDGTLISAQKLESAINRLPEDQQRSVRVAALHAEQYKQAQDEVDKLNAKIASAKFGGDQDAAEQYRKQLEDAQKVLDEKRLKVQADLDNKKLKEDLISLPQDVADKIKPVTETINLVADDRRIKDIQQKTGSIIQDYAETQTAAVHAVTEAQRAQYSDKLKSDQEDYEKNLYVQAAALKRNQDELDRLREKKLRATDPKDAERLAGAIATMEGKIRDSSQAFVNSAQQGKKFGLIKGDIRDVGQEFDFSAEAAAGVKVATDAIGQGASDAAADVASIGEEFKKAMAEAQSASNEYIAEAAGLVVKLRNKALAEAERKSLEQQLATARANAQESVRNEKDLQHVLESEEIAAGKRETQRRQAQARDLSAYERQLQLEKLKGEQRIGEIENELLKKVAKAQLDLHIEQMSQLNQQRELEEKIRVARVNGDKRQAAQLSAELHDLTKSGGEFELRIQQLTEALNGVKIEASRSLAESIIKTEEDSSQLLNELAKKEVETITTTTEEGVRRRSILLQEIRERDRQKEISDLLTQSDEFKQAVRTQFSSESDEIVRLQLVAANAQQELVDKRQDLQKQLADGAISQEEFDAQLAPLQTALQNANDAVQGAQQQLLFRIQDYMDSWITQLRQSDPGSLLLQQIDNVNAEIHQRTVKDRSETETQLADIAMRKRISAMKTLAEQERALALFELDKRLEDELKAAGDNQARITEIHRQAAVDRAKIEQDYVQKTSIAWQAMSSFFAGIQKSMSDNQRFEDAQRVSEQRDALKQEITQLVDDALAGKVLLNDFYKQLAAKRKALSDASKAVGLGDMTFLEEVFHNTIAGIASIGNAFGDHLDVSKKRFFDNLAAIQARSQLAADATGARADAIRKAGEDANADLTDSIESAALDATGSVLGAVATMAATTKANIGQLGEAALLSAINVIEGLVFSSIPAIYSFAMASPLGPIGGAIAATLAVGTVLGLLAVAKSKLQQEVSKVAKIKGSYTGEVDIEGPGTKTSDSIPRRLSRHESVVNADATLADGNRDVLRWGNRERRPFAEYFTRGPGRETVLREIAADPQAVVRVLRSTTTPMAADIVQWAAVDRRGPASFFTRGPGREFLRQAVSATRRDFVSLFRLTVDEQRATDRRLTRLESDAVFRERRESEVRRDERRTLDIARRDSRLTTDNHHAEYTIRRAQLERLESTIMRRERLVADAVRRSHAERRDVHDARRTSIRLTDVAHVVRRSLTEFSKRFDVLDVVRRSTVSRVLHAVRRATDVEYRTRHATDGLHQATDGRPTIGDVLVTGGRRLAQDVTRRTVNHTVEHLRTSAEALTRVTRLVQSVRKEVTDIGRRYSLDEVSRAYAHHTLEHEAVGRRLAAMYPELSSVSESRLLTLPELRVEMADVVVSPQSGVQYRSEAVATERHSRLLEEQTAVMERQTRRLEQAIAGVEREQRRIRELAESVPRSRRGTWNGR